MNAPLRLGVCSWSLRARSPEELAESVRACGVAWVQLALDPISAGAWDERRTVDALSRAGVRIASGMMTTAGEDYSTLESIRRTGGVRPDGTWPANLAGAERNAALASRLSLPLVTFHAGFLPHGLADAGAATVLGRLAVIASIFGRRGVRVAFETGQESAETLCTHLDALGGAALVNFDPANMILYGMGDPTGALRRLAPFVRQAHVKDATPSARAGEWGSEVRAGTGAVDWRAFVRGLRDCPRLEGLMIEREAGDSRVADARAARDLIATLLAEHGVPFT